MKKPLIIIAGPTASKKTQTAIDCAKKINGEVISADSMQVYKYMDIGTAKVTEKEMDGVRHHLIDVLYPDEDFSVAKFKDMAKEAIDDIVARGKIPILAGGTGFYINALLFDVNFNKEPEDKSYREYLYGLETKILYEMLQQVDKNATENIHENNTKKIIRALEYHHITGEKISDHNKKEAQREMAYDAKFFVLNMDRKLLYDRINLRVDIMVEQGLVKEVEGLLAKGYRQDLISLGGIGYKEIINYINGLTSLDTAIEDIKQNTRHFAKRQLTWFRNKSVGYEIDVLKENALQVILSR